MLVLQVSFRIQPDRLQDFITAIGKNATAAVRDEPGCRRFDVIQDNEDPSRISLYEVYDNEAALDAHRRAPHYLKWRELTQSWHAEPAVRHLGRNLYPSDAAWR